MKIALWIVSILALGGIVYAITMHVKKSNLQKAVDAGTAAPSTPASSAPKTVIAANTAAVQTAAARTAVSAYSN